MQNSGCRLGQQLVSRSQTLKQKLWVGLQIIIWDLLSSHLERRAAAAQVALGSCELTCESSKPWDNQVQLVSVVRKVSYSHLCVSLVSRPSVGETFFFFLKLMYALGICASNCRLVPICLGRIVSRESLAAVLSLCSSLFLFLLFSTSLAQLCRHAKACRPELICSLSLSITCSNGINRKLVRF